MWIKDFNIFLDERMGEVVDIFVDEGVDKDLNTYCIEYLCGWRDGWGGGYLDEGVDKWIKGEVLEMEFDCHG